jgi:hypothetical protein
LHRIFRKHSRPSLAHLLMERDEYLLIYFGDNTAHGIGRQVCLLLERLCKLYWGINAHKKQHYLTFKLARFVNMQSIHLHELLHNNPMLAEGEIRTYRRRQLPHYFAHTFVKICCLFFRVHALVRYIH